MNNPEHPLYKHTLLASNQWWKWFIERIMTKCREKNVDCIIGFAEPIERKDLTIDRFITGV